MYSKLYLDIKPREARKLRMYDHTVGRSFIGSRRSGINTTKIKRPMRRYQYGLKHCD